MAAAVASYSWTLADATPRIWHSMSANATGDVIVAGEAGGRLHASRDGGATWTMGNSTNATWISSASSGTGDRIYAVQYGGAMYVSRDFGSTWSALTAAGSAGWEAVTVSQDGTHVAAVVQNGPLVLSSDSGASWHAATMPDGQPNHWWRWIDSSSDGHTLVAVSHNGEIYRSTDSGATWEWVTVSIGAGAVSESWYRVKLSADGRTIAVVANSFGGSPGTGIYVSHDGGASWTRGFSLVADYTFLAMSSDGQTIAASVSNTGSTAGRVVWSGNGGASFTPLAMPGSDTNWRAITMSAGGDRMAAVTGAFNTQSTGLLYVARSSSAPAPSPAPAPTPAPTPAPAPAPSCNPPAWDSSIRYMPGDTVMRNGTMYVATQASATAWNVNSPPEWTPSYWSVTTCSTPAPAPGPSPSPAPSPSPTPAPAPSCTAPEWNTTTRYMPGDRVTRLGTLYVAKDISSSVWNVNSPPEWTPSYWAPASCP
jgi:hypothetical protein